MLPHTPTSDCSVSTILVLEADRLYAELLRQQIAIVFPRTQIKVAASAADVECQLASGPIDLFVLGIGEALQVDAVDVVLRAVEPRSRVGRILAVITRQELRIVTALRAHETVGVFDAAAEAPDQFAVALEQAARGGRYWSPSVLETIKRHPHASVFSRFLTPFEQLVLYVVGCGSDDNVAAEELGISPATVSTVRRDLHRKLGVQHRGDLIRVAAQSGYVRFTPTGVIRPGFANLLASYRERRARRASTAGTRPAASRKTG